MADEKFRKTTEGLLSSVLISTKSGVPLHHLEREYREVTLSDLPLQKLGFPSLELYIRSIPHCARIETNDKGVIVVKGVPNESNKHIAKLVSGQKKGKKRSAISKKISTLASSRGRGGFGRSRGIAVTRKSRGGFRGSYGSTSFSAPFGTSSFSTSRTPFSLSFQSSRPAWPAPKGQAAYRGFSPSFSTPNVPRTASAPNFQATKHLQSQVLREVQNLSGNNVNKKTPFNINANQVAPQSSTYQIPPRLRKLQEQKQNIDNSNRQSNEDLRQVIESRREQNQFRNSLTDLSSSKSVSSGKDMKFTIQNELFRKNLSPGVKGNLKENIVEILKGYTNGLWAGVLCKFYKDRFGEPPENLLDIVKSEMVDEVEVKSMMNDRAILYLKKESTIKKPEVKEEKSPQKKHVEDVRIVVEKNEVELQKPTTKEEEELFISDQEIPRIGETFAGYICHVDTIDRFFIQKADSEIMELAGKIQSYYESNKKEDVNWKPKIGCVCCATFSGQWYRARVIFSKPIDKRARNPSSSSGQHSATDYNYTVLYVDYGNMDTVGSSEIRRLNPEFSHLPAQAIQCKLHGITREGTQQEWSEKAVGYFNELTCDELLDVRVTNVRDNILDVDLMTVNENSIANSLVDKGLAISEERPRAASLPIIPKISPEKDERKEDEDAILSPKASILQRLDSLSLDVEEDIDVCQVELPSDEAFDILVSAVNSLNEISAILLGNEYRGRLQILEIGMQVYYDNEETEKLKSIDIDGVYAAFHDEAWYRVRVTEVKEDKAEICFVDRGDTGFVQISEIRKLPSQFKRLPLQAIELALNNLPDSESSEHIQALSDMILGKECVAMLVERLPEITVVDLYDTSTDEDIKINEQIAAHLNLNDVENFEQLLPMVDDQSDAFVSYISDSGVLNIVLAGPGIQKLDDLIDELGNHYSKGVKAADLVNNPEEDKVVCTRWKEDGVMYRALITCVMPDEKKVQIEFLDFGNRDVIGFVALRDIPEHLKDLRTLPPQTVKCTLADCPEEAKALWKYGLAQRLSAALKTQTVVVKTVKEATGDELASVILLKADPIDSSKFTSIATDIAEICNSLRENSASTMIEGGPPQSSAAADEATSGTGSLSSSDDVFQDADTLTLKEHKMPPLISQMSHSSITSEPIRGASGMTIRNADIPPLEIPDCWCNVHITNAQSPSKFFFQLLDNVNELINLMEKMLEFYKDTEDYFEDCGEGDVCAVLLQEADDTWYRGIIRSRIDVGDQVGVLLADFGDVILVPIADVRELDHKFHSLPFQAIKGSLSDISPPPMDKWPKKACKKFAGLVNYNVFVARIHNSDLTYPVPYLLTSNGNLSVRLYDTSDQNVDLTINDVVETEIK